MLGVLVDVAQDVGELQRAAEMMRERDAVLLVHAEHADRQPPDRARDAIAIKIERRPVRRADVLRPRPSPCRRSRRENPPCGARNRAPPAPAPAVRAPAVRRRARRSARAIRASPSRRSACGAVGIRDVVDQPAERIDLEHRLALRARQNPHRGVERAARGAARRAGAWRFSWVWRRSSAGDLLTAPGARPERPKMFDRTIPWRRRAAHAPRRRTCRGGHSRSADRGSAAAGRNAAPA